MKCILSYSPIRSCVLFVNVFCNHAQYKIPKIEYQSIFVYKHRVVPLVSHKFV